MPLYIPWLTETIKKRGVRYLLHHYLGQFFEEKLTLDQLSIDIYEGKGSIKDLALDVDGLNDELDFIPFKFLDGCLIGQISVEVPWSSLATDACKVELEGAKFVCRLKTSADASKTHCTESTLLSRSLMTSSMQMAEDIVTNEDNDYDYESPNGSMYSASTQGNSNGQQEHQQNISSSSNSSAAANRRKDANQMFEGLEMFAQLIDSVLRRTKLTARNTLFQIQPHQNINDNHKQDNDDVDGEKTPPYNINCNDSVDSNDEFCEPIAKSESSSSNSDHHYHCSSSSDGSVEFFIKFFRCEEIIDQTKNDSDGNNRANSVYDDNNSEQKRTTIGAMPETITKLLTLEDVEMRIGGKQVSNLIGKHTIMIKFNGQKSEISIFSGSPLLAVISHEQLRTFFNVFDGTKDLSDNDSSSACDKNQKLMSPEDYAKIENQLLETVSLRTNQHNHNHRNLDDLGSGRRWVDSGGSGGIDIFSYHNSSSIINQNRHRDLESLDYHSPNSSALINQTNCLDGKSILSSTSINNTNLELDQETTLENIEAFSCELKLPGIWLCILRDGETLPPLIKPYADSINSFDTINKYIDQHIKIPHIRLLALKVALDITINGINIFLGDLDISEHLHDDSMMNPTLHLLQNDQKNSPMNSSRYKISMVNNKDITIELLTKTRILFDPTIIDRIVYEYKLIDLNNNNTSSNNDINIKRRPENNTKLIDKHHYNHNHNINKKRNQLDLNLTIKGEEFMIELLCPIPDLRPEANIQQTQLRPQSFLFDFKNILSTWHSDKLNITANQLIAYVKTQPQQSDNEAVKFIESINNNNNKIILTLEPSPSNLDTAFPNDVEQALNESSMFDSIYVGQTIESKLPVEAFQTKRKVVRASFQDSNDDKKQEDQHHNQNDITNLNKTTTSKTKTTSINNCDNEKIITPGDRQHLLDYLNQTVMSTKLSLSLHLPICEVEFEDKEQLDLIYNRFGNDFVFWQPKAFSSSTSSSSLLNNQSLNGKGRKKSKKRIKNRNDAFLSSRSSFKQPFDENQDDDDDNDDSFSDEDNDIDDDDDNYEDEDENVEHESEHSYHSLNIEGSSLDFYDNEVTCKVTVDELYVKFNHQSCALAMKQEISAQNLLLGVIIDINKKPCTVLSLVADNLELTTDSEIVLEGNTFGDKNLIFSLTADIRRPTKSLKDIKLAVQLVNGLFNDFKSETFTRFWQSINVTDEPIMGYIAPKIVTELHIDILNTSLSIVRDGARPALLSIDELYLTSMVVQQTSQVMIRLIADEVSLYLKRNKSGLEIMKNYVCLIDSGLIDLDVKFSDDGKLEFNVMNNVITVRACQDSLSALFKLFNIMIKSNQSKTNASNSDGVSINLDFNNDNDEELDKEELSIEVEKKEEVDYDDYDEGDSLNNLTAHNNSDESYKDAPDYHDRSPSKPSGGHSNREHNEKDLLEDAMNNFSDISEDSLDSSENDQADNNNNSGLESDDSPPIMQTTTKRDPNACLLDESNPKLGNLFSTPLLPSSSNANDMNESVESFTSSTTTTNRPLDESGFFVIGNDDVGAGIIGKAQQEPIIRKLIDGPINIVENHFKMTKPRTIPEMLATSLERYVLKEMTLVVNLYGGRDFDEDESKEESLSNTTTTTTTTANTNTSASVGDQESELLDTTSIESLSIRSRANSTASTTTKKKLNNQGRKHYSSDCSNSSLKKGNTLCNSSGGKKNRKKHLSEGSRDIYYSNNNRIDSNAAATTIPRVRFGEGAVNLWESLDLMSSPDFLGTSSRRPSQTPLSSDSKIIGGTWRQTDVCIQLTLTKVKLLYELGDYNAANLQQQLQQQSDSSTTTLAPIISWRFMLFIHEIEIKDRIHASDINKMLYEYCTESMPKRNTQMLTIKNIATINPSDGCEECDLRVSLKPLRLNIDQDTLLFLIEFFTCFGKSISKTQQQLQSMAPTTSTAGSGGINSGGCASSSSGGTCKTKTTTTTSSSACKVDLSNRKKNNVPSSNAGEVRLSKTKNSTNSDGGDSNSSSSNTTSKQTKTPTGTDGLQTTATTTSKRVEIKSSKKSRTLSELSDSTSLSSSSSTSSSVAAKHHRKGSTSPASTSSSSNQRATTSQSSSTSTSSSSTNNNNNRASKLRSKNCDKKNNAGHNNRNSTTTATTTTTTTNPGLNCKELPTHCHSDGNFSTNGGGGSGQPIYIKSFIFSPDVPIRLDYHAKHLDFEQGALAGILMGLAHLDHSELTLRRVQAKHGMRGLDRVLLFTLNSWMSDIKRNQLPSILSGVGPMHSVIQLFQGMRDLIWMPIDHYRKDRRLVRGLQRGASSFSSSTAMAAINLMNRFISIVQCTAQIAHDIVTPPTLHSTSNHYNHHHNGRDKYSRHSSSSIRSGNGGSSSSGIGGSSSSFHHNRNTSTSSISALNQPRNFCEGVAVGFNILKEGFNDTARNVAIGMQAEDYRSAVGELVRQIPSTLLNPIISATEGAQNVLVGIRNQIAPDARREDQEKWKRRVRGK